MQGTLRLNENGRWEIVDQSVDRVGRLICEITSGDVIEVEVAGHWICTRIESSSRSYPPYSAFYYAVVQGVSLYPGQKARLP